MITPSLSLPVLGLLELWLTPIWLLSIGVAGGLLLALLLLGLVWLLNRAAAEQAVVAIRESVLMPALYLACAMVALAVFAAPQMPVDEVWSALARLPSVGTTAKTIELEPRSEDTELAFAFDAEEVQEYQITSSEDVRVAGAAGLAYTNPSAIVEGGAPYVWDRKSKKARGFDGDIETIYLTNIGDAPNEVEISITTDVRLPEVRQTPITALVVAGILVVYALIRWLAPNVSNIAAATAKDAIGQPLFLLFTVGGALAIFGYIWIPYNTFGEDVKMLKDSGLSTVMILAFMFAVWTASVSISDEIEGKTALTLLSKPIARWQFIVGKYLGILWPVLLIFLLLGAVLLATVSYKVVYDARESSNPTPNWQLCNEAMISTTPGLTLAFFEAALLTAVSVAISTRLPMLPNLVICGAVYTLGHLTPLIVQSSAGQNEYVSFFGKLVATVLPMLDHLNIQAAIAAGQPVPYVYLGWTALYTLTYVAVMMLLALLLFEDRDLA